MFYKSKYDSFLRAKIPPMEMCGFDISETDINPNLMPHQKLMVKWAVHGGRRAVFGAFGLGKTVVQLEAVRMTLTKCGGRGLIVVPLGVRQEFVRDAVQILKWPVPPRFIRRIEEAEETGIYLTNYETIRDGKMDPRSFQVASLDEASCLRGFGGTKTFREFMRTFAGDGKTMNARTRSDCVKYRFVATATPAPNEYIELLAYAAYLGIMDVSAAKTRFFKRDSTKADKLTIHPHKVEEFWLWVASWALFVQRPSDLGFSDDGYVMPEMDVRWHMIASDHAHAGNDKNGQGRLFRDAALGVSDASTEKRDSLSARIEKMLEIRAEHPGAHRILWHDLELERHAICKAVPEAKAVWGNQDMDEREANVIGFSDGEFQELAAKPCIAGSGCNFQRHCNWAIFLGIGFKFNDFIQAVHRINRFLQTKRVRIDLIYTDAEREIKRVLERKWEQHKQMVKKMEQIVKQFGMNEIALASTMVRALGVERVEVSGKGFRCINNDCVPEVAAMPADSIHLILTSVPFSTQYEYSPNYADFGHSDHNQHFFEQMGFLLPELLRILQPGRLAVIHVKDRIVPSGMTGLGFQTVYPFHAVFIAEMSKAGFGYMGMKTIVTDVVRENNQTYRLGWTEQCKDGSKMGVGMPEYLLIFRKPPTDRSNGYADVPVVKNKENYSRSRWQTDAHGFTRSSGNRSLSPDDLRELDHCQIFRLFREYCLNNIYDFEHHVKIGESLDQDGRLPTTFMLLQPPSHNPDVWTDVARMLTLNSIQSQKGQQMHLCPLQFDIVDRAIEQWTMPGETVLDPFGGLMTVPYRALIKRRHGIGIELSPAYFCDGVKYCEAKSLEMNMPTLFDITEEDKNGDEKSA